MENEVQLGFGPSPRPTYVYVGHESPTGWYMRPGDENVPIEHAALTGYVRAVECVEKEYKGESNKKLQVHMSCGPRKYIIRSGLFTAFSRCVLASLALLKPEHFGVPLAIETQPGESEARTVFATLFNATNGERIEYEYPKSDAEVERLLDRVTETLRAGP